MPVDSNLSLVKGTKVISQSLNESPCHVIHSLSWWSLTRFSHCKVWLNFEAGDGFVSTNLQDNNPVTTHNYTYSTMLARVTQNLHYLWHRVLETSKLASNMVALSWWNEKLTCPPHALHEHNVRTSDCNIGALIVDRVKGVMSWPKASSLFKLHLLTVGLSLCAGRWFVVWRN